MPRFEVELEDGRKFEFEADSQPSESEIMDAIGTRDKAVNAPQYEPEGMPEKDTRSVSVSSPIGVPWNVELPIDPSQSVAPIPRAEPKTQTGKVTLSSPIGVPMELDKDTMTKAGAAVLNTAASVPNFMLSPVGTATMPIGGTALGKAAIQGVFAGLSAKGGAEALGEASVTGDTQKAMEGALMLGLAPTMATPSIHPKVAGALTPKPKPQWQGPIATGEILKRSAAVLPESTKAVIETLGPEEAARVSEAMTQRATAALENVEQVKPSEVTNAIEERKQPSDVSIQPQRNVEGGTPEGAGVSSGVQPAAGGAAEVPPRPTEGSARVLLSDADILQKVKRGEKLTKDEQERWDKAESMGDDEGQAITESLQAEADALKSKEQPTAPTPETAKAKEPWEMTPKQRASEGWIEVWRQDRADVKEPTVGSHWGTKEQALAIAKREIEAGRPLGKLRHAFIKVKNPFKTYDGGFWEKPIAEAKAKGHDTVVYKNEGEKVGGTSYIPLSKEQVREIPNLQKPTQPAAANVEQNVQKSGKKIKLQTQGERAYDIIDWIQDNFPQGVKITSKADFGNLVDKKTGAARNVLFKDKGEPADIVIKAAELEGIKYSGEDDLVNAVLKAGEARKGTRAKAAVESEIISTEEKQAEEFGKVAINNEGRNAVEKQAAKPIAVEELKEGDQFTLKGEKFTVKSVDADGIVTVDDGRKFGRQQLQDGEMFYPDKGKVVSPKPKEGLFEESEMPFNLVSEKTEMVEPKVEKTGYGNQTLAQHELFGIQKVVVSKDPTKSADAAQQMYGGAKSAADKLEEQLRVVDSDPETKRAFVKEQRQRLKEVVSLLRQRAAKSEAESPPPVTGETPQQAALPSTASEGSAKPGVSAPAPSAISQTKPLEQKTQVKETGVNEAWQTTNAGRDVYKADLAIENAKDEFVSKTIKSAPSYPKLLAAYNRFERSLHGKLYDPTVIETRPWELLDASSGVMNAKSQTAKTLVALENAIFKETGLPRKVNEGNFRGGTGLDWNKVELPKTQAQEIVGMGGAVPGEFNPGQPMTSAIKNAAVDRDLVERGEKPMMDALRKHDSELWSQAMNVIDADWQAADKLIARYRAKPFIPTDVDTMVLLHRRVDLKNEYAKADRQYVEAAKEGLPTAEGYKATRDAVLEQLHELEAMLGKGDTAAGTMAGRAFRARQLVMNEDYSLASLVSDREITLGRKLTDAEAAELRKIAEEYKAANDTLTKKLEERDKLITQLEEKRIAEQANKDAAKAKEPGSRPTIALDAVKSVTTALAKKVAKNKGYDLAWYARKLARHFWQQGIHEPQKLVDAVHGVLDKVIPELERRETMDALSGYGRYTQLTKDAVSVGLRDAYGQLQQIGKLEDMATGKAPLKSGFERRLPTDAERQLIKQVEEAKRKGGYDVTDPETQLRTAMQAAERRLINQIADLEKEIKTRELIVKDKRKLVYDDKLNALKARRDALREQHDEIFKPGPMTEAERLALWKERTLERIEDYKERIAAGDVMPRKRPEPVKMDREALQIRYDLHKIHRALMDLRLKDQLKQRNFIQKAKDAVVNTITFSRAAMTGGEFSAVLRQGAPIVFSRPITGLKALGPMFKAFWSEKNQFKINEELQLRDNAQLYERAGLEFTEMGTRLSTMEEQYMFRVSERIRKIWGVNLGIKFLEKFQRAFTTYLNVLRADAFDAMVNAYGNDIGTAKAIANYINVANGRGSKAVGRFVGPSANAVFFAPRYTVSRFQYLAGQPFWMASKGNRAMILKEYGRALAGAAVVYTIGKMAGGTIETDPRSPDFGKVKLGDTRIDPLAGLSQATRFLATEATGWRKNLKGQLLPVRDSNRIMPSTAWQKVRYGQPTGSDVAWNFVRSKLSPSVSAAVSFAGGKDVAGKPFKLSDTLIAMSTPITYGDVLQAIEANGVEKGLALGTLAVFGMGVQTYTPTKGLPR